MKKIAGFLSLVSIFVLTGCSEEKKISTVYDLTPDFRIEEVLKWDSEVNSSLSTMSLNSGSTYVACLEQQAFIVTTRDFSFNMLPVKDESNYVYCKNKVNNTYHKIMDVNYTPGYNNTGAVKFCVGGYTFIHMRVENGKSDVVQLFEKNGKAKICIPQDVSVMSRDYYPIVHPNFSSKFEAIQKILKSDENSEGKNDLEKVY